MTGSFEHHHYNPDWLSDDALVANFVARIEEFSFLRDELSYMPKEGTVQHYLLIGLRGAGKTTLLKRLAVAIRRDADLNDHLIALSFPEELYQVKDLEDFWWAACDALADELDTLKLKDHASRLFQNIEKIKESNPKSTNVALELLLETCREIQRRPVLLVDNLDMVFQRIDKKGRKLKDPYAAAYWELREILSTPSSPIVIGGSVRLSEPFTDYDKAFYDFFIPKRLGKMKLEEVRQVLDRLADAQNVPEVKRRLRDRPSRIESLYELTGGNPRALGLIFELLRQGPNSRAVEDFERLMDITTPYFKARFEDLSEQAQVVMHALAVRRFDSSGSNLRFGHTAFEISKFSSMKTSTVSTQLEIMVIEGLVEKSASHGRTQYRIAEQMFRLWLQMRSTKRIRQNVIGLTEFLEAMFDLDELQANIQKGISTNPLAEAQYSFAVADGHCTAELRDGLETHGADQLFEHVRSSGGKLKDYLPKGDLRQDLEHIVLMRDLLESSGGMGLTRLEQEAFLGSISISVADKQKTLQAFNDTEKSQNEIQQLRLKLKKEYEGLEKSGLTPEDIELLYNKRSKGYFPLPLLTPKDVEVTCSIVGDSSLRSMIWRLVGAGQRVKFENEGVAREWVEWGKNHLNNSNSTEWAKVVSNFRRSQYLGLAEEALDIAFSFGASSKAWYEKGLLLKEKNSNFVEAEAALKEAIKLDPVSVMNWVALADIQAHNLSQYDAAQQSYFKALEISPLHKKIWLRLAILQSEKLKNYDESIISFTKYISLNPADYKAYVTLGYILSDHTDRYEDSEKAFRKALEIDSNQAGVWNSLGVLLAEKLKHTNEAEAAFKKALELNPKHVGYTHNLGLLLSSMPARLNEASVLYQRTVELAPDDSDAWGDLGAFLHKNSINLDEAEVAYRKAIDLNPENNRCIVNLAMLLARDPQRYLEVESLYRSILEKNPSDPEIWDDWAVFLADKLKNYDEAESAFLKALELDSSNSGIWNNLGVLYADKVYRFQEAETAFIKATELKPHDYQAWRNLGSLLGILDRDEEAESAFRKAIALNPNDPYLWSQLGELLELQEAFDEAFEIYKKAEVLHPDSNKLWNDKHEKLHLHRHILNALRALQTKDLISIRQILESLLNEKFDIAGALVSEDFVEIFLDETLKDIEVASRVLDILLELGYGKYARPLLLAFEAIIKNQPNMLEDVEPEIKNAALNMYQRLTNARMKE
jgi:tetratricopeptide (TPR) repeat protein